MSLLVFVLVMEYLSRTLKRMSELLDFKWHPMCKTTKLTHLIFSDNLMISCIGDISSVTRVKEALDHFSEVTGLIANQKKSNMFVACVDEDTNEQLLNITGFTLGALPIKYLGLPLS